MFFLIQKLLLGLQNFISYVFTQKLYFFFELIRSKMAANSNNYRPVNMLLKTSCLKKLDHLHILLYESELIITGN